MATLTMPQLGESVTEGTVLHWLRQPGDAVALDEPIVEIETDKVTVEVPSQYAGTLTSVHVAAGETVVVGTALAEIDVEASSAVPSAAPAPPQPARPSARKQVPTRQSVQPSLPALARAASPSSDGDLYQAQRFSPAVTRLAEEHRIDPSALRGTGAGGRVTRRDVLAAVESMTALAASPARPFRVPLGVTGEDQVITFTPTRRRIAERMSESVRNAPHAWLLMETDVTGLVQLRDRVKEDFQRREGLSLTYLAFAARAICQALREYPLLNATWDGDQLVQRQRINLGLAVETEAGLVVPVLHDADRLSVAALAIAIDDLADRARSRRLTLDDVGAGTFTLDNTGIFGTVATAPIINHPQVAIITTEAIQKRAVVVQGDAIAVRSMMNLCLSFDHRVVDGSAAAGFAARARDVLQAIGPDSAVY